MSAISKSVFDKKIHPCYDVVITDDFGFRRFCKVRISALHLFLRDALKFGSVTIMRKSVGTFNSYVTSYEVLPF